MPAVRAVQGPVSLEGKRLTFDRIYFEQFSVVPYWWYVVIGLNIGSVVIYSATNHCLNQRCASSVRYTAPSKDGLDWACLGHGCQFIKATKNSRWKMFVEISEKYCQFHITWDLQFFSYLTPSPFLLYFFKQFSRVNELCFCSNKTCWPKRIGATTLWWCYMSVMGFQIIVISAVCLTAHLE